MNIAGHKKKILSIFLFYSLTLFALGQDGFVKGTIISSTGDSLENIKITVKENPGSISYTDKKGFFSINIQKGQHIVAEYKSKMQKVVEISDLGKNMTIEMDKASELVNTGYQTLRRKEELAVSAGYIRNEQLENLSSQTLGEALFGQINGLRVFQNAGTFPRHRQPDLDIRGISTTQDNSILVLVDGVERPLFSVVPEEVASVTVLRDAAAKAKYGLRGGNGVLLVETKRGRKGKTHYHLSYEQGLSQPTRLPQFLNAADYARSVNQALINDGLSPRYNQLDIERYQSGEYPFLWPNVNWVQETLSDMGQFSKFNFNASGGSEYLSFYMGFNYQNDHGLYKYTEEFDDFSTQINHDRLNFRTNLDIQISPLTSAQIDLAGHLLSEKNPSISNITGHAFEIPSAMFPVKNEDGSWGGTNRFGNNPVAEMSSTGYNQNIQLNILVNLRLKQDLNRVLRGLTGELFVGFRNLADYWENSTKSFEYKEIIPVTDISGNVNGQIVNVLGIETDLNSTRTPNNIESSYDISSKLNYTRHVGLHAFDGWVIAQQEQLKYKGTNNTFRYRNFAGNLNYGLASKYFIDVTVSYSGTNRIQEEEDRYGFFPAAGIAWLLSKESFMERVNFVNSLKIRGSYGKVGNGQITISDLTHPKFGYTDSYVFGGNNTKYNGRGETDIPIGSKTFESSFESNFGFESQLFKHLYFNGEIFHIKRKDIFVPSQGEYSQILGILPGQIPDGIIENKGYEVELSWKNQTKEFDYFLSGKLSHYKNKIIDINEEYRPYDYMKREGQPIGQFFGWESQGFFNDNSEIAQHAVSEFGELRPGDIRYVDQNKDGQINLFDQKPIGNTAIPEIYYSVNLGFNYKGFSVSAMFQGTAKSSTFLNQPHVFWPLRDNDNISTWYKNYWSENNREGVELPRLTSISNENNFRANDIWIRNNSFLKLRYAEISYSLPKKLIAGLGMQDVKIYIHGMNLFSLDQIKYKDPENTSSTYPSLRTYTTGIKLTF